MTINVSRKVKILSLAALAAAAVLLTLAFASPQARADQPKPGITPQLVLTGELNIWTNKGSYYVGEWAEVCYTVPAGIFFQITDHQGPFNKVLRSDYGDGYDCFWGQVTPPFGQECLRLQAFNSFGVGASEQTCFSVESPY